MRIFDVVFGKFIMDCAGVLREQSGYCICAFFYVIWSAAGQRAGNIPFIIQHDLLSCGSEEAIHFDVIAVLA
jgi:hypothetical protein